MTGHSTNYRLKKLQGQPNSTVSFCGMRSEKPKERASFTPPLAAAQKTSS